MRNSKDSIPVPALIVSDFDGTLKKSGRSLSAAFRRAAGLYVRQGGRFVIATARPLYAVEPYIREIRFIRYLILCNGSQIFDRRTRKSLYSGPVDPGVARYVADRVWNDERFVVILIGRKATLVNRLLKRGPLSAYQKDLKAKAAAFGRARPSPVGDALTSGEILNIEVSAESAALESFRRDLVRRFGAAVSARLSWPGFLEVYRGDASKGRALDRVAGFLNVPRSGIMAFGDADNDIDLFRRSGVGVAMKNSTPGLLSRADHVCGHYLKDGVAKFISRLVRGR